jgi:hypothetical protein
MSVLVAPAELPFAPRPYSDELLSSWLLRVAAANLVSLQELLDSFEDRYGRVLINVPIDYAISDTAISALARFCRVAPEKIQALDLRLRAAHLSPALLLHYPQDPALFRCPRCSLRRVRYAFCPLCLASQRVIHVRWDWSVACLIRCVLHRALLLDGCPACGEPDPVTFPGFDSSSIPVCRSCGNDVTASRKDIQDVPSKTTIQTVKDGYRGMLLGITPDPALLGKATNRAFRQFVKDMLQLLTRSLNPGFSRPGTGAAFLRHDIVQIITALIENAAPTSDRRLRSKRYSRGLVLWATLLKVLSGFEGSSLEQQSLRWPVSLRRRFVSGSYYRTKNAGLTPHTEQALASELTAVKSLRYTACAYLATFQFRSPATHACKHNLPAHPVFCPRYKYRCCPRGRDLSTP